MNRFAVKNGVIAGIFFLVIVAAQYVLVGQGKAEVVFTGVTGTLFGLISVLIMVAFAAIAVFQHRETEETNSLQFGAAFLTSWVCMVIGSVISTIGNIVVMVVSPGFIEARNQVQIDKMYEKGMPEEQVEMAAEMMNSGFMSNPVALGLFALVSALFMGAILSLIVAAIFKGKSQQ